MKHLWHLPQYFGICYQKGRMALSPWSSSYSAWDPLHCTDSPHLEATDTCQMRHPICLENLCLSRYVACITKFLLWFLHHFADHFFCSQHQFPLESCAALIARCKARFEICILDTFIYVWVPLNKALEWQEECLRFLRDFLLCRSISGKVDKEGEGGKKRTRSLSHLYMCGPSKPRLPHILAQCSFWAMCSYCPILYRLLQKNSSGLGKARAAQCNYTFLPDRLLHSSLGVWQGSEGASAIGTSRPLLCLCPPTVRKCLCWIKILSGLCDPLVADASCRAEYLIHCILPQSHLS